VKARDSGRKILSILGMSPYTLVQTLHGRLHEAAFWMYAHMGSIYHLFIRHLPSYIVSRSAYFEGGTSSIQCDDSSNGDYDSADEFFQDVDQTCFIPGLPHDLVLTNVWPRLLDGASAQNICQYRHVCRQWRELTDSTPHWVGLRPLLVGVDRIPPWFYHGPDLTLLMYMPVYLRSEYHRQTQQDLYDLWM
jgi:hypothetical protein